MSGILLFSPLESQTHLSQVMNFAWLMNTQSVFIPQQLLFVWGSGGFVEFCYVLGF